jgi:hypothetical protein
MNSASAAECSAAAQSSGRNSYCLIAFANHEPKRGAVMIGSLILSLSILLAGALPWWPYTASARAKYHRPWDWLMDQNQLTGHIEVTTEQISAISRRTTLEDSLVEQPTAAFEKGPVRDHDPRSNKPLGPDAARHNVAA